jgi:hypothetical protein
MKSVKSEKTIIKNMEKEEVVAKKLKDKRKKKVGEMIISALRNKHSGK